MVDLPATVGRMAPALDDALDRAMILKPRGTLILTAPMRSPLARI